MATENPTGDGGTVALDLTGRQRQYLRCTLVSCKAGRESDLRTHPDHRNAGKWLAAADAYERLIVGVDTGEIVPDDLIRCLVRELADEPRDVPNAAMK